MAGGGVINVTDVPADLIVQIGKIGLWLQAIGVVILIWIVAQIISFILNRKRLKEIYHIKEDMKRIEDKIDSIVEARREIKKK